MTRRAARWPGAAGVALVALSGCAADPPLQQAAPPDPPAACVLDTAALDNATKVTWTPDQSTASDTRCVYDAGPNASGPAGPAFLTVSLFARTQADAAAERELLAQLCVEGSRVDVNKADGGFVCRVRRRPRLRRAGARRPGGAGGELGHPDLDGRATLATAISDQLATPAVGLAARARGRRAACARASSRMAAPSVSLRRSFTYARCVLYGSVRGAAGGFVVVPAARQAAARAVPRVGDLRVGRERRGRDVPARAVVRDELARSGLAPLRLAHRPAPTRVPRIALPPDIAMCLRPPASRADRNR